MLNENDLNWQDEVMKYNHFKGYYTLGMKIINGEDNFEDPLSVSIYIGSAIVFSGLIGIIAWWFEYKGVTYYTSPIFILSIISMFPVAWVYGFLAVRHAQKTA